MQENPDERDAEARVNAVKGLISVCETITSSVECSKVEDISLFYFIKNEVMQCLFRALDDYSVDNRGDVGSWVREAAMDGLQRCAFILLKKDSIGNSSGLNKAESASEQFESDVIKDNKMDALFDEKLASSIVGGIIKQAVEKMDKIREMAAKVLQRFLYDKALYVPFIPYREKLEEIIPDKADSEWGVCVNKPFKI